MAPFLIAFICAFLLSKRPALWRWVVPLTQRFRSAFGPLQPTFVFIGVLIGFLVCCLAGRYPQTHNIYKNFVRFHEAINPQSAYYPTASQVKVLAESTLPKDKILVVIGGNSVFLGMRQNVTDVWTIELQKLLGDQFAILNVGMPDGYPSSAGAVTFEMLAREYPRIIYAFNFIPLDTMPIDGGETYRYFFWDAYYKHLLELDPDRRKQVEDCRRDEWKTTDGQELHIGAFVNSYANATDLWTWIGYQRCWTVWSDRTANSPFKARRLYADEHKNHGFADIHFYQQANVAKPANAQFKSAVIFQDNTITGDPLTWGKYTKTWPDAVPADLRGQSIACLHWFNPWTAFALTKDELAAQDFCYESARQTFLAAGYQAMECGRDYPGEEYADGTHLDAEGGRHLARQLAPLILDIAQSRHYLAPDQSPTPR